ncbi:MAG: DUF4153 domain-containing protein [Candidatus Gracilibacteria bacterium]|nr:DUF4153 domain-containing protein [Candidatus Gracilibacteria bacterium]
MKNIFLIFSATKLKDNLVNIIKRFPIAILLIVGLSSLFIINLHYDFEKEISNYIIRIEFSLIITFFLNLGICLFLENFKTIKIIKILLQILTICFGGLFFVSFKYNFLNYDDIIFFILTLVGILSFIFISPYVRNFFSNEINKEVYYSYFYKISVIFLISFIFGGILFTLGTIGISAIFELFDIKDIIDDKIYGDWTIISLSVLTPIFALTQLPQKETFNENKFVENVFFSFLVKYIAIPFIYIYFIILYAYSAKVLINFNDWPNGEVSWMVIGFSTFGYLIYMFSSTFEEQNKFIKFYRKHFPFVVIPQLFMLFYAIYLRIAQYDLTMNRYFVVIFGIWLGIISLYFVFSNKKYIFYIPAILTLFTIIISIGPWGVFSLPEARQLQKLENNLTKAGILKNYEIIPLKEKTDITENLSKEIYSGIKYLCDYNNCESIKTLFSKIYNEAEKKHKEDFKENMVEDSTMINSGKSINRNKKYTPLNNREIVNEITTKIKVTYYSYQDNNPETIYFSNAYSVFPIDTKGYSKIMRLDSNSVININNAEIELIINSQYFDYIDIKEIKDKILIYHQKTKNTSLTLDESIYDLKGKKGEYRVILENITLKNPNYKGNQKLFSTSIYGYILIK